MWKTAVQVAGAVGVPMLANVLGKRRYGDVKENEAFEARKKIKQDVKKAGLPGWVVNTGDDEFGLDDEVKV
jgi:tRNA-specific adenosine deaminase 1